MNRLALTGGVLGAIAAASPALARPDQESVMFSSVPSDGLINTPANAVRSVTFNGGYALGVMRFSGTLTAVQPRTWQTDSRILVTAPGGASAVFQPFISGTTYTSLPFNGTFVLSPGVNPAGMWTFRFFESFDDGGPGNVDATWDVTVVTTNDPPPAPTSIALGQMLSPGRTPAPVQLGSAQVQWYSFSIPWTVSTSVQTYLDIDTSASALPASSGSGQFPDDTEIALFDSVGALVATDDDSGRGFTSQLSFGAGTRPPIGDGEPFDGRNGSLPSGTYYLAIAAYHLQSGPANWSVLPTGTQVGTIAVNIRTNLTTTPPGCYANCDSSTAPPILNVNDFICFQAQFAAGTSYANCDLSTAPPVLNVNDFICFQARFAAGCP